MEIQRIYARNQWIGKGIGAALMKACLVEAQGYGVEAVWLGVWERNPKAIAFYERWGFEKIGEHIFVVGADRQRDHVMSKRMN